MQINMKPEVPSFGIAYIAQALRKAGHEISILDIDSYRYSKEEVADFLKSAHPDIVGIGGLATVYPYLDWLISRIRELLPGREIILGGAVASSLRERCFQRFDIDFSVIGEGEETVTELVREVASARRFSSVRGIGYRDVSDRTKIIFTESRPLMASLEDVPFFDDSLFPLDILLKNTEGTMQIHVQRGCPSRCTFCFNCYRVVSNKVRYRPIANVLDEIDRLKDKYKDKIRLFALSGECLTMNKRWLIDFCKEIIRRRMKIRYRVTSRVDTIDEERVVWLKKSGCVSMSLGLESGSPKILKNIKKGATVEQGRRAALLSKKYISTIEANIILGYIGEDRTTLKETVSFCKEIGIRPALFFATPFPGTELYRTALEMGRIRDEEEYLMNLDTTLTFHLALNLTDMPDEEAFDALREAVNEIERFYIKRELRSFTTLRRALKRFSDDGFIKTARWASKRFREVFAKR